MKKDCIIKNLASETLSNEIQKIIKQNSLLADVKMVLIMPDVHLSQNVCVGSVLATTQLIYPNAIGADIGCGMTSVKIKGSLEKLTTKAEDILRLLQKHIPIIKHRSISDSPEITNELLSHKLSSPILNKKLKKDVRITLGTLGKGNHFIEFQKDNLGNCWLMVHTGSRTAGKRISDYHKKKNNVITSRNYHLDSASVSGLNWVNDMDWAIKFAKLNRRILVDSINQKVLRTVGMHVMYDSLIDCSHDHIIRETHNNEDLWVHRKGVHRLQKDKPVIIAGSMGTNSYHVIGKNSEDILNSCSHGSGRTKSRTKAKRSTNSENLLKEMKGITFDKTKISRLYDEAPSAYKDIEKVMKAQKKFLKKVRTLTPIISFKGI